MPLLGQPHPKMVETLEAACEADGSKAGYLSKKDSIRPNWLNRWFVLDVERRSAPRTSARARLAPNRTDDVAS